METLNSAIEYPVVFLNSIPKSGTHLMKQIIAGIPGMSLNPNEFYEGYPADHDLHCQRLQLVQPGQFVAGHVYYSSLWSDMLKKMQIRHIFLNRDLRDIVVSYTYFITGKYPYHPLRSYLLSLPDRNEQFLALIKGVPELEYPSISIWYEQFAEWSLEENSLQIAFEDLVGSYRLRRLTMERLLDFLWGNTPLPSQRKKILDAMERSINPRSSYTFRSGKTGDWRNEFNKEVKTCFKEQAGHLLIAAGYETDNSW